MMFYYLANNSVDSSSSIDEEDDDFILLELTRIPQSCFEARMLDGRLLERLKMDFNIGGRRKTALTTLQYVSGQLYIFQNTTNKFSCASKFTKR